MSHETCSLCQDEYKSLDVLLLLNCGHQFHYECAIKIRNKDICAMCKQEIIFSTKIIWKEEGIDFFEEISPEKFHKTVFLNTVYHKFIQDKCLAIQQKYQKELILKYKKTVTYFINMNMMSFYIRVLCACEKGFDYSCLYDFDYSEKLNGIPMIFLLFGPKDEGLNFFYRNGMIPLIMQIQEKFGEDFIVYPMKKNFKILLFVKWTGIIKIMKPEPAKIVKTSVPVWIP